MVSDLGITYPILSDESREYIRDYDVLHPDEGIARPSLFVVDRDGIVRWQYVGMNAADRPDIDDVMEQLHLLQ
jgi:alkyl hydroperoxide reductase subunit AhpC